MVRYGDLTEPIVDGVTLTIVQGALFGLFWAPMVLARPPCSSWYVCSTKAPSGRLRVLGRQWIVQSDHVKGAVGYVPLGLAVYPTLVVRENLAAFGRMSGLWGCALRVWGVSVLYRIGPTVVSGHTQGL